MEVNNKYQTIWIFSWPLAYTWKPILSWNFCSYGAHVRAPMFRVGFKWEILSLFWFLAVILDSSILLVSKFFICKLRIIILGVEFHYILFKLWNITILNFFYVNQAIFDYLKMFLFKKLFKTWHIFNSTSIRIFLLYRAKRKMILISSLLGKNFTIYMH